MYDNHKTPIKILPGYSSYIRFRVIFDKHLDHFDLVHFHNIVASWYLDCTENEKFGKNHQLISFDRFINFFKPIYTVRFDIVNTDTSVIDHLITYLDEQCFPFLYHSKVQRIEIGFSNIDDLQI